MPASSGEPLLQASIKLTASDFIVREQLDFVFDNEGEHLYLHIRKCGLNTQDVVQQLQQAFRCQSVDIGVSGLKDKNALTDQWISVRTPLELDATDIAQKGPEQVAELPVGEFLVLESHRHSRKLRRGAHRLNHFIINLRKLSPIGNTSTDELADLLRQRLELIQSQGFANYFGPQRFGHNAQNLPKAERLFKNPKRKISRAQRGILLSAARSQLFNSVCAERVKKGNWNRPMVGEPMILNGTNSYFIHREENEDTGQRCHTHDIHPTGPLWGKGAALAENECGAFEKGILQSYECFIHGLEKAGLEQQRRALRAEVQSLIWDFEQTQTVKLDFKLLKGVYATSFLSEFMINY